MEVSSGGLLRQRPRFWIFILPSLLMGSASLSVLDGPFQQGLTVSPDRKTVLITRVPDPNSDLMLIENFR
jgi:hypothetical protein